VKTFSGSLTDHYALSSTTLAQCLKITRADAAVFCFTSHDRDLVVGSQTYLAGPGLEFSGIVFSAGLATDNLELRILYDDAAITRADLLSGKWDNANFELFEVDYTNPNGGSNILLTGKTGEAKIGRDQGFVIELRSLKQNFQRPVGAVTQKTCRYRLGDSNCTKPLATFTFSGVPVTAVTSSRQFTASSRTEAAGYFQEGLVTFTTGLNADYSRKVKTFAAGVFELVAPFPFAIAVGDQFTAVAGCQKRLEDCRDKFNNVLNFGGEPHLVGIDILTAVPGGNQ
jgi:uncharacterized phage protein (TIGR02218 family)